ncbi:MAG: LytTR family transcriptional regulator DNA-binding domain-containing protein [Verrucomicrobia bacterium]|nr:LytTR family transcriptional regulator DNA-binding domain-containing protein [Verrucomicrobiota bacterium]
MSARAPAADGGRDADRFSPEEIQAVTSCENYTQVTLVGGERLLVRRTMRQWAALLPEAQFVRVHRGLLLNLAQIGRVERGPDRTMRVGFLRETAPAVELKSRHWPALRTRLEAWRLAARAARRRGRPERAVAVLPFDNLGGDRRQEIFCDGVSEELLDALAKVPGLRVAARTSAFSFKGRKVPVGEIAHALGVDFVVEGSVRGSAGRVRIAVRLSDAHDGVQVWSATFDREVGDILGAQSEMARLIAGHLQLKLPRGRPPAPPVHPEAHRLAIEGRHYWGLRTADGLARADRAFARAIALMPDHAPAHAGLADVGVVRAMYRLADGEPSADDDLAQARRSARRALELDATLCEPHATLGFALFHGGRLAEGLREFPRAFAANPSYATGYQFYAWTLCGAGQIGRALEEYARAIALDPLAFINLDRYAAMLALAGRWEEALEMSERAAALRPDVFVGNLSQRAVILWALGRTEEALAAARTVRHLAPDAPYRRTSDADAIFVLQQCGAREEAAVYAAERLARLAEGNYLRGFILAAAGRPAEAIGAVASAPPIMLPFLYWSPVWAEARAHPDFSDLIARLGRRGEYRRATAARSEAGLAEG